MVLSRLPGLEARSVPAIEMVQAYTAPSALSQVRLAQSAQHERRKTGLNGTDGRVYAVEKRTNLNTIGTWCMFTFAIYKWLLIIEVVNYYL